MPRRLRTDTKREGSKTGWHDPVYNVATGLGFTFDLHRITDLTPEQLAMFREKALTVQPMIEENLSPAILAAFREVMAK